MYMYFCEIGAITPLYILLNDMLINSDMLF